MNQHDFVMPEEARSNHKITQIKALNEMQLHAIQSNKRGYLNHTAIIAQVESTLASSGFSMAAQVHYVSVYTGSTEEFDSFTGDPTM